jgi:hypothetical protein
MNRDEWTMAEGIRMVIESIHIHCRIPSSAAQFCALVRMMIPLAQSKRS